MFGLLERMCSLPCVARLVGRGFDSVLSFYRKWLEYWITGVFLCCVPWNAILSIWLHSLLNSGDSGLWHTSFRV